MATGISSAGDIIQSTIDGASLGEQGDLWEELRAALTMQNEARDNLRAMFTYPTVRAAEEVAQVTSADDFEDASEYGVPRSLRATPELMVMGCNFTWRDLASRFTWEFLADASADQIRTAADLAFAADTRQLFTSVMGCLFNPTRRMNKEGTFVYPLYNGDGWVPPTHNETAFTAPHTHYLTTGAATVDGEDLVGLMEHVSHHGYADRPENGQLVIFANRAQTKIIRGFRVGATSPYDYIPSEGASTYLTDQMIIGEIPPANYGRVNVIGSYGPALISEEPLIPAGYLVAVASGGPNDPRNPVGFREHANVGLRGLRQFGGNPDYPIQDSVYQRGWGTGVRHRGAAAVAQVTVNTAYTVPPQFATVVA